MKISIVTPVLNNEKWVAHCINSVLKQTYENYEHIIVDGGSTDRTLEIIKQYHHIKLIHQDSIGLYNAINTGIENSSGDIIGILNSDDMYLNKHVLNNIVNAFAVDNIDCFYADIVFVSDKDESKIVRVWRTKKMKPLSFLFGWMPPHPTFYVRKDMYTKFGLYNTDMTNSADYELMLRFLSKNKLSSFYLPKVIVKMRMGGISNKSFLHRLKAHKEDYLAWKLNKMKPLPFTLILKPLRKIKQYFIKNYL